MTYFRDVHGNVKGRTETLNETTYLYDEHGRTLAVYDSRTDLTRSASGSEVLWGNQLLTYLHKPC